MRLFTVDLYRSLALGFALGAAAVYMTFGFGADNTLSNQIAPPALAATLN